MSNKPDRRKFIKNLSVGGITAGIMPTSLFGSTTTIEGEKKDEQTDASSPEKRIYNGAYTGEYLNRVAFPIGGIGAGMFCLEGTGAISHMSVRKRPEIFNEPGILLPSLLKDKKMAQKC